MFLLVDFTGIGHFYTLQGTILLFLIAVCKALYLRCYGYMMAIQSWAGLQCLVILLLYIGSSYC